MANQCFLVVASAHENGSMAENEAALAANVTDQVDHVSSWIMDHRALLARSDYLGASTGRWPFGNPPPAAKLLHDFITVFEPARRPIWHSRVGTSIAHMNVARNNHARVVSRWQRDF